MAANFSSAENTCEGENCEVITDVTYYVKEKKTLCDGCASKEGCIGKARKGGFNLYCEEHDEEMKLYCKMHGVALCYSCALIDHQQPCVQQGLDRAIMESKASLITLKEQAKDKLKLCRVYGDQIHKCRKDTDTHLQALKDEVDSVINKAIKQTRTKRRRMLQKSTRRLMRRIQNFTRRLNKSMKRFEKTTRREKIYLN